MRYSDSSGCRATWHGVVKPVTDIPKVRLSGVKVVFEIHKEVVRIRLGAQGDHKAAGNNQHTAGKYGI
jgi:hypothetical protein